MPYSHADLTREIGTKIEYLKTHNGRTLHPAWIAQAIFADHQDVNGADAEFYRLCAWSTVRREVREQINEIEEPSGNPQMALALDGFEHLQCWYVVKRDGEQQGVRVDELTDAEIDAKAEEYERKGRALISHSDELRRYKELRHDSQFSATFTRAIGAEVRTSA